MIADRVHPEPAAKPRGFASSQSPVVSMNPILIRKRWLSILTTFASDSFILNGCSHCKPEWWFMERRQMIAVLQNGGAVIEEGNPRRRRRWVLTCDRHQPAVFVLSLIVYPLKREKNRQMPGVSSRHRKASLRVLWPMSPMAVPPVLKVTLRRVHGIYWLNTFSS